MVGLGWKGTAFACSQPTALNIKEYREKLGVLLRFEIPISYVRKGLRVIVINPLTSEFIHCHWLNTGATRYPEATG